MGETPGPRFAVEAVCFDLLTALLDSWMLREAVVDEAGHPGRGEPWRHAALREGALVIGLPGALADRLLARWGDLRPFPEVPAMLDRLRARADLPLATATNCPEGLARRVGAARGDPFAVVVSVERAGVYKPDPRPYCLALAELRLPAGRVLFVAGLAHDVGGALRVGMPVVWANRLGLPAPPDAAALVVPDLARLPGLLA